MKPMLAAAATIDDVVSALTIGPMIATPKIDGIRCLIMNGVAVSRKLLPIPNLHVQKLLGRGQFNNLDGELICDGDYSNVQSQIMSVDKMPDFKFCVFDDFNMPTMPYEDRIKSLATRLDVDDVETRVITDLADFLAFEQEVLNGGYEGVILRDPKAQYKFGRSTVRERGMLKVKRMEDSEAVILGTVPLYHNENEATRDNLGRTKRSSAKAGKVESGLMGALSVRDLKTDVEFEIGTGFTASDREKVWKVGDIVTYRFMPHGTKDRPRHPSFKGIRNIKDIV